MSPDFTRFRDYYFLRCFSCEKYRNDFNTGKKVYINSVQYFHDLEDDFQRDFEGGIFRQPPNTKAFLLKAKSSLTVDEAIEHAINNKLESGEWVMKTSDFKFFINGYIFCLTIIPKIYLRINEKEIVFNEKHNISDAFWYLLNQYTQQNQYAYISLYDAETFMEVFYRQMTKKGYSINCGCVDYENLTQDERLKYYSENNITKLLFTKDKRFSYQNEYRLFIHQPGKSQQEHIEESGIDMRCALLNDLVYLSPKFVKEKELTFK